MSNKINLFTINVLNYCERVIGNKILKNLILSFNGLKKTDRCFGHFVICLFIHLSPSQTFY